MKKTIMLILSTGMLLTICAKTSSSDFGSSIVGFSAATITKGETDIDMTFVPVDKEQFFTLNAFREIAEEGDVICFYDFKSNIVFAARAKKTQEGVHFISEKTGEVVDNHPIPPIYFFVGDNLKKQLHIVYKREANVTSELALSGAIFQFEDQPLEKDNVDMKSLSDWMRRRVCYQIYEESQGGVFTNVFQEGCIKQGLGEEQDFIQSVLKSQGQDTCFFFYIFEGGNRKQLIAFDIATGDFIDGENGDCKIEVDSKYISRFEAMLDKFGKCKIPPRQRLSGKIIDDLNFLLKERFFDEKHLCELVFKDGTTTCVTIDKEKMSVRDVRRGIKYDMTRSDISGLRSIANTNLASVFYGTIRGNVHFLSAEEVRAYEENLIPRQKHWLWSLLIVPLISMILNKIGDTIFPPNTTIFKKTIVILSGVAIVIWIARMIQKRVSIKQQQAK